MLSSAKVTPEVRRLYRGACNTMQYTLKSAHAQDPVYTIIYNSNALEARIQAGSKLTAQCPQAWNCGYLAPTGSVLPVGYQHCF